MADQVFRSDGNKPADEQEPAHVGSDTDLQTDGDGSDALRAGTADPPARAHRDRRPAADRDDVQAWGGWARQERALVATCADLLAQTGASDALGGHDLNGELDEGDFIILQFDDNLQQGENYSALRQAESKLCNKRAILLLRRIAYRVGLRDQGAVYRAGAEWASAR
eukprot:scaffold41144_cov71-Phaeocystis_antarctica.AAC.4